MKGRWSSPSSSPRRKKYIDTRAIKAEREDKVARASHSSTMVPVCDNDKHTQSSPSAKTLLPITLKVDPDEAAPVEKDEIMHDAVKKILSTLGKNMNFDSVKPQGWPTEVLTMIARQTTHPALDEVLETNKLKNKVDPGATKPVKVRAIYDWLCE